MNPGTRSECDLPDSPDTVPASHWQGIHPSIVSEAQRLHPVCGLCHRIFQVNIPTDSRCSRCQTALFRSPSSSLFRRLVSKKLPSPVVSAPIQTLSSALVDFLSQPGIIEELDGWRKRTYTPGVYTDICDGNVWRTALGPDGKPFFDPEDEDTPKHEVRIGVTMSFDWYVLFFSFLSSF